MSVWQTNIELLEYYYGDLIEKLIVENNYPIDLDDDYDYLLKYIYKTIVRIWFKGKEPSPSEFEKKIRSVRERSSTKLSILISYILSRYVRLKGEEIVRRVRRDDF